MNHQQYVNGRGVGTPYYRTWGAPPPSDENVLTAVASRSGFNVRVEVGYDKAKDCHEVVFNTFARGA
jgi:hypothetical protein